MGSVGYYLTHPDAIIYGVASALLYPVLFLEVLALLFSVWEAGQFSVEMFRRWRARKALKLEDAAKTTFEGAAVGDPTPAIIFLKNLGPTPVGRGALKSLGDVPDLSRSRILKALADAELEASRRLERTRMLIRFGPVLGLMGTLIPISPALVALAQGDVQTLSNKLVVAFSTTVVGLLIGAVGYAVTTVRDRLYQRDIVDVEYVFDRLEA